MTNKEIGDALSGLRDDVRTIIERLAVIETKLGVGGKFIGYVTAALLGFGGAMIVRYFWQ